MEYYMVRRDEEGYPLDESSSNGNNQMPAGTQSNFNHYPVDAGNMAMPRQWQQRFPLFPQGAAMLPQSQPHFQQQPAPAGMSQQTNFFDWNFPQSVPAQTGSIPQLGYGNNLGFLPVNGAQPIPNQQMTLDHTLFNADGSMQEIEPIDFSSIDPNVFFDLDGNDIGLGFTDTANQFNPGAQTFDRLDNLAAEILNAPENINNHHQFQGVQQGLQQFSYPPPEPQPAVTQPSQVPPGNQLTLPVRGVTPRPASAGQVAFGLTLPSTPTPSQPPHQKHGVGSMVPGSRVASVLASPKAQTSPTGYDLAFSEEEAAAGPSASTRRRAKKTSPAPDPAPKRRCHVGSCVECKKSKTRCHCDNPSRGKNGLASCKRCAEKGLVCVWDDTDARSRRTLEGDVESLVRQALKLIEARERVFEVLDEEDSGARAFVQMFISKGYEPEGVTSRLVEFGFDTKVKNVRRYLERKAQVRKLASNEQGNLPGYRLAKRRLKNFMSAYRQEYREDVNEYLGMLRAAGAAQGQPSSSPASESVTSSEQQGSHPTNAIVIEPAVAQQEQSQAPQMAHSGADGPQAEPGYDVAGFNALAAFTYGQAAPAAEAPAPAAPAEAPRAEPIESDDIGFDPMASDDDDLFADREVFGNEDIMTEEEFWGVVNS